MDAPVGGCADKSLWSPILEEYLQLSDDARLLRLADWYGFCDALVDESPKNATELAAAWKTFTHFRPVVDPGEQSCGTVWLWALIFDFVVVVLFGITVIGMYQFDKKFPSVDGASFPLRGATPEAEKRGVDI